VRAPDETWEARLTGETLLAGLMIVVGLVGVVVPVVPGLLLVWGGVAVWALSVQDSTGWTALAIATVLLGLGSTIKYLLPGRKLRESGVPWRTMAAGALLGVVGFFVIPVVGIVIGFVLGIYLAERLRLRAHRPAVTSSVAALRAVGWSILIELATGLLMAATWLGAVLINR